LFEQVPTGVNGMPARCQFLFPFGTLSGNAAARKIGGSGRRCG
jgi:hypothetical protein